MTEYKLNSIGVFLSLFCLTCPLSHALEQGRSLLIADFEGADYGAWSVQGEAFADGPAQAGVEGFEGKGFAGSHQGGYRLEGTLTSPPFKIEKPYINFLLAGGDTSPLYVTLLLDGQEIKTAIPNKLESMLWTTWNVKLLMGRSVQFQMVDDKSGHPEGYLFVDSIYQSDTPQASSLATRTLNQEILTAYPLNPDPDLLPGLGIWRKADEWFVSAVFPKLPGFTCDSWCYELADCEVIGASALKGGIVELVHRITRGQHVFRYKTEVIPSRGSIEFGVKPLADPDKAESLPGELPVPNLCFQLRRARGFKSDRSEGNRSNYPGFVERCFIFTEQGRTFLLDTDRQKIPVQPANSVENNPPWVQNYIGNWKPIPKPDPHAWAGTSKDRFTVPIIGTVSKDREFLVALADDSADLMCQAWHDCLHSRPHWQPEDAPPAEQTWRLKVYVMENNPDKLLKQIEMDFPNLNDHTASQH